MLGVWGLLVAIGCTGANLETLIDELRVVAMVAEPPEVAPGEPTELEIYVADPSGNGAAVFAWTCTNLGDGCMEEEGGAQSVATGIPESGRLTVPLAPSPALAGPLAGMGGERLEATAMWALACTAGTDCPLVDNHPAAANRGLAPWGEDLACQLEDPGAWMEDLSIQGTSLAYRLLNVSVNAPEDRHQNPTLTPVSEEELVWKPEEEFSLVFEVAGTLSEEARVFNYATGGGFTMTDTLVEAGEVTLDGVAPEEDGEVQLWVVLNDGLGGVAVWTGTARVE